MLGRSNPKTYPPRWSSALKRVQAGDDEPGSGDDQPCGDHYISDEMQCHQDGGGFEVGTPAAEAGWSQLPDSPEVYQSYKTKVARKPEGQGGRVDLSTAELNMALQQGRYAIVSAGRNNQSPEDAQLTDEQVSARSDSLERDLVGAGYMYSPGKGKYAGDSEDSFLVMAHEAETKDVIALGKKYNQDSVIVGDKGNQQMIYTTGPNVGQAYIGSGMEELADDVADNYTKMDTADGVEVTFSLNLSFDQTHRAISQILAALQRMLSQP
jgi:hypothetical protein